MLRPVGPEVLQRMLLYETTTHYYLLGYYGDETRCRLLTFSKSTEQSKLVVEEDTQTYTPGEAEAVFQRIHTRRKQQGGLQLLCEAYGILGCFRFLEGYYLFLITKRKPLGSVAGHTVYGIADTTLIHLNGPHNSWAERRYRKLLLSGVDLTRDFFFSYTYNLSYTVQHNLDHNDSFDPFDCIFVWNDYLTRDLRKELPDNKWVLPLIHGSWRQKNMSIFGKTVQLTLISRRSRRFAGTRYLKRGINQFGWVANEVETEQIVSLQNPSQHGVPSLASIVQIRGSIPLFWGQATSALNPRPSIRLYNIDPLYHATHKHFDDLRQRYGDGPVVVLNLVKKEEKHPRETILLKEFARAISFLNQHFFDGEIIHAPWDVKAHMRKNVMDFRRESVLPMRACVEKTGFCAIDAASAQSVRNKTPRLQRGVLRSNCIDCLDRTNISQYLYGLMALGYQLCYLDLLPTSDIDPDCSMAYELMQMYEIMGHDLALQYGGSQAHGTFFEKIRGNSEAATQSRELLRSIQRYYSNAVSDPEKQDAINLFLGHFIPDHNKADIWELESDYLLHCGVDWEKQKGCFGLRPNCSLGTRPPSNAPSTSEPMASSEASQKRLELFPVPIISQAGDPEATPPLDAVKGGTSNGWTWGSLFCSPKENAQFKVPDTRGGTLCSFEELLSINPIVEVRLCNGEEKRKQRERQRVSKRAQRQDSYNDRVSDSVDGADLEKCLGLSAAIDSRQSLAVHSVFDALCTSGQRRCATTMSEQPLRQRDRSTDNSDSFSSLFHEPGALEVTRNCQRPRSETELPGLRRRSWFSGLTRRSVDSQRNGPPSSALRTLSTPAEVEKGSIQQLGGAVRANLTRTDPVEEFWDDYWSITEKSLTHKLTRAEKIAQASNKREAARQAREINSFNMNPMNPAVEKMTATNVFLDDLFEQCLQRTNGAAENLGKRLASTERLTGAAIASQRGLERPHTVSGIQSDGDVPLEVPLSVRSNINELLYCSASGPEAKILEKWSLADKQAEADYYRNLSWIVSPVDSLPVGSGFIKA